MTAPPARTVLSFDFGLRRIGVVPDELPVMICPKKPAAA